METVTTLKVHRICPLVLLVKVGWRQGRALGSKEDKVIRHGMLKNVSETRILMLGLNFF